MHGLDTGSAALLQRWLRLQMHVRCGLSAHQPGCIRFYLHTGLQLARQGFRPAVAVHLRMLQTLIHAAQDEALPWFWRSVCLEHVNLPLAQLTSSIGKHDPIALAALNAAVEQARRKFPASPASPGERISTSTRRSDLP